jgi:hypothetical protein
MNNAKTTAIAAPAVSPFPEQHRSLLTELFANIQELAAKIERAASVTERTTELESAKAAIVKCAKHMYAHFETLEAKAKSETVAN